MRSSTIPVYWQRFFRPEPLLFTALLFAHLIPIWSFEYFPTQDGPAHLYNARILGEWIQPVDSIHRQYFELNTRPDPTWFGHLILASFMKLFSPSISEKLFLSIYILLFPLSIRYALGAVGDRSRFLSVLGFPFVYNSVFHWGFISFAISMAFYCLFIGYWIRYAQALTLRRAFVVFLLSTLLYLTHVITMAAAYSAAGIIAFTWWCAEIVDLRRTRRLTVAAAWQHAWRLLGAPLVPLLPALLLFSQFMSDRKNVMLPGHGLRFRLLDFLAIGELYVYQRRELALSVVFALALWMLCLWFVYDFWRRRRQWQPQNALLLVALFLTIVYFVAPEPVIVGVSGEPGGGFLTERLNLFPFLTLLLWLGSFAYPPLLKRLLQFFGVTIALAFLAMHAAQYRTIAGQLEEYRSALQLVPSGSTVLPLAAAQGGLGSDGGAFTHKVDPFLHASNRVGAERPVLVLLNYEAELDYFPVRFRRERSPYEHIGTIENFPPTVNLLDYTEKTGGQIDYVLVWLGRKRNTESVEMQSLYHQLGDGFERVFVSENGLAELFRHNRSKQ